MTLNERAVRVADALAADPTATAWPYRPSAGARVIDCGVTAPGGLATGLMLARACLADLGDVSYVPGPLDGVPGPAVLVTTDHPVSACLASQYAGWRVQAGQFFAMASGPMRALSGGRGCSTTCPAKRRRPSRSVF